MQCKFCGKEIPKGTTFCPWCQREQKEKNPLEDTDVFLNLKRQDLSNSKKNIKPLTEKQQLFPYGTALIAAVLLCILLVYTSRLWGDCHMDQMQLADFGITAHVLESTEIQEKEENEIVGNKDLSDATDSRAQVEDSNIVNS